MFLKCFYGIPYSFDLPIWSKIYQAVKMNNNWEIFFCVCVFICILLPKETEALLTGGGKKIYFFFFFCVFQCISITLATDATRPQVTSKYFVSLLSKGAEAFRHESADQAKQHNILSVNVTAKAASTGENGKNCFHIVAQIFVLQMYQLFCLTD